MMFRKILIVIFLIFSNNAYSKDGYKDVKFDMTFEALSKLIENNNATFSQLNNLNPHIIVIEDLYKYDFFDPNLNIYFVVFHSTHHLYLI